MKPQLSIALALIWREGELLIARRAPDATHLPGVWEFPGGKVEAGETPAEACVREAREEVGLEVEVTGARDIIAWDYADRAVALHPLDCRIVRGEARALECAQVKWCAPADLDAAQFPAANAGLIQSLQNSPNAASPCARFTSSRDSAPPKISQKISRNAFTPLTEDVILSGKPRNGRLNRSNPTEEFSP